METKNHPTEKEVKETRKAKDAEGAYKEGDPVRVKATGQIGKVRVINTPVPGVVEVQSGANIAQYSEEDIEHVEEEEIKTYNDGDKVRIKGTGQRGTVRSKKQVAREPAMIDVQLDGSADTVQYADKDVERVEEKKEKA
jgi:hypothetical protein